MPQTKILLTSMGSDVLTTKIPQLARLIRSVWLSWQAMPAYPDAFIRVKQYQTQIAEAERLHGQDSPQLIDPLRQYAAFRLGADGERADIFKHIVDILDRNPEYGTPRERIDNLYDLASALTRQKRIEEARAYSERAFNLRDSVPRQAMPLEPGQHFQQIFERMDGDQRERRLLATLEELEQPAHPSLVKIWGRLESYFRSQTDLTRARIAGAFRVEALAMEGKVKEKEYQREVDRVATYWERNRDFSGADSFRSKTATLWLNRPPPQALPTTGDARIEALAADFDKARRERRKADLDKLAAESLNLIRSESVPISKASEYLAQRMSAHYLIQGDPVNAMLAANRAVVIADRLRGKDHPDNSESYTSLAMVYGNLGNFKAMVGLYERIHANFLAHLDNPRYAREARSIQSQLPGLWLQAGDYTRARRHYEETLWQVDAQNNLELKLGHRTAIASIAVEEGRMDLAVHYAIQAVNLLQVMRSRLNGLDQGMQQSFIHAHDDIYRQLAAWLMDAQRQAEAIQVLRLMEQEGNFDFLGTDSSGQQLEISEDERRMQAKQADINQRAARIGVELAELDDQAAKRPLTEEEASRRAALMSDQMTWKLAYERNLADLERLIDMQNDKRRREIGEMNLRMLAPLQTTLGKLGAGTVLVHYVMLEHETKVLLTTAHGSPIIRSSPIGLEALTNQLEHFRQLVRRPQAKEALLDAAQALYRVLIEPIEKDLKQADAKMLMLAPDAGLRYLPFAALHDGKQYLIERYGLAFYSEAARDRLRDRPKPDGTVAAFGLTRAFPGFNALPGVRAELAGIVGVGMLKGSARLDDQFDMEQLRAALSTSPSVLHLASHFSFHPGKEKDSFLVLGTGEHVSLAEFKPLRFDGIDLVTLSACETAFGGGQNANGREISGLAALVQENGAQAVMATLWQVADSSTADLMKSFYRLRLQGKSKAEALREAQLTFIRGIEATPTEGDAPRGVGAIRIDGHTVDAPAKTDLGWAHPYYWAPFILMGNWL